MHSLHIWINPQAGNIVQTIRDSGELLRVKDIEKYHKAQGMTGLYRVVVLNTPENPIRVIPPPE